MSIGGIGSSGGGIDYQSLSEMRQKMFAQMDQNGDGSISKSEFQAAADKRAQETGQTIDVNKVFAAVDTNQDGVIDKTENDAAMSQMHHHHHHSAPSGSAGALSQLLGQIFSAMDTNQDGVVDQTEYDAAMQQIGGQQAGSTASAASSSGTTDSAATTAGTAASSTAAAADPNQASTLATLIQQLLQDVLSYEKYQNGSASSGSGSQTPKSVSSYA